MKKREAKPVAVDDVPELMAYELAKRNLDDFKKKHAPLIEELSALAEAHNTTLEAADKVMRANSYTCAPFNLQHFTTKYDADQAFIELGRNGFLAVGGKIDTKEVYGLDGIASRPQLRRARSLTPSSRRSAARHRPTRSPSPWPSER